MKKTLLLIPLILLAGCTAPIQSVSINDEKSDLQKYHELVVSDSSEKIQYETSKPDGFVKFSWVPEQSPPLNFSEGKNYELSALVDPKDYNLEDFNATQVFYLEIVENNQHTYYGPFETKHSDFTQ